MEQSKKILELGCGMHPRPGAINVDKLDLPGVDVVWDLDKFPYPFKDEEFDEIYGQDIIEHLDDVFMVMEELYRILKLGGTIYFHTTYVKNEQSFTDPSHKHFFTLDSFDYFDNSTDLGKAYSFYTKARFKILNKYLDNNNYTNFLLKKV